MVTSFWRACSGVDFGEHQAELEFVEFQACIRGDSAVVKNPSHSGEAVREGLVADQLDVTRARLGLGGAEAVQQLSVLRSNDDFGEYWDFH